MLKGIRRASGLTLGLLGLDPVALGVARRAMGCGMRVIFFAHDAPPALAKQAATWNVERVRVGRERPP